MTLRSELISHGAVAQLASTEGGPSMGSEDRRPPDLLRWQPAGQARSAVTRSRKSRSQCTWAVGPAGLACRPGEDGQVPALPTACGGSGSSPRLWQGTSPAHSIQPLLGGTRRGYARVPAFSAAKPDPPLPPRELWGVSHPRTRRHSSPSSQVTGAPWTHPGLLPEAAE